MAGGAEARRHRKLLAAEGGHFEIFADPLGEAHGFFCRISGQKERELFTAKTVGGSFAERPVHNELGQFEEHFIADGVPVNVVELLEVVDVDHYQRERLAVALGLGHGAGEVALESTATAEGGVDRRARQDR